MTKRWRINGDITWVVERGETDCWVAVCESLQLTVQSDTWPELLEDINLTLEAMFKDILKSGKLEQFMIERGWDDGRSIPVDQDLEFEVPFHLTQSKPYGATVAVH